MRIPLKGLQIMGLGGVGGEQGGKAALEALIPGISQRHSDDRLSAVSWSSAAT